MKKLFICSALICLLFIISSICEAQTIYKKDPGFFTPVLESFELEGGSFVSTQLIGPAIGYRFNEHFDLMLHPEFLRREAKSSGNTYAVLNLGIIGGYTTPISERLNMRSELALYKAFEFEGNASKETRFLNSGLASSSLYWKVPLFKSVSLIPNFGAVAGYGADTLPPNAAGASLLTNDFDGFVYGPRLGLDTKFGLSEDFSLILSPTARMFYNRDKLTEFRLNFKLNF